MKVDYMDIRWLIGTILLLLMSSCKDINSFESDKISPLKSKVHLKEGRLHFSDREMLQNELDRLKDMSEEEAASKFDKYYDQGFYSLRPKVRAGDNLRMEKFSNRRKLKLKRKSVIEDSELDDLKELIGDEQFASLINDEGEIQVGDSVYKYTEQGLYFVHKKDINHLYTYLKKASDNLSTKNKKGYKAKLQPKCLGVDRNGRRSIDGHISYYRDPSSNCQNTSTSRVNKNEVVRNTSNVLDVNKFINNLPNCNKKRSRFSSIFGTSVYCIDKFSSKYRVKTKFWNQGYLLTRSIGVSTKHQRKRLGIWWSIKTNELQLGINQAYFEYTISLPNFRNMNTDYFVYKGIAYDSFGRYLGTKVKTSIPDLPFKTDIEIAINLENLGLGNYTITPEKVKNIAYKEAVRRLKNVFQKWQESLPNRITLIGITSQKIIINHVNKSYTKKKAKNIREVFDWQGQVGFSIGTGMNGNFKFTGISLPKLYKYNNAKVDIYGIARRGSTWKGSRLVFKE